jgi:hypothetical protein|tara:strand:+ start:241 stop:411 length:171 start_codon:yes stop_codon:yes gene_type:complete
MTSKEYLIQKLNKILKEIDQLCDQVCTFKESRQHEKDLVALYSMLDVIIEKIENSK